MVAPVIRDVDIAPPRSGSEGSQGRVQDATASCWTGRAATNCFVVAEYGLTTSYGSTSPQTPTGPFHRFSFGDLTPGVSYHVRLKATDPTDAGNPTYTQDYTLTQTPAALPPGPAVTVTAVSGITATGAAVNWTTATALPRSGILYSTNPAALLPGGTPTAANEPAGAALTNHTVALTGLTATTRYYYRVVQTDAAGNTTTTAVYSFVTT